MSRRAEALAIASQAGVSSGVRPRSLRTSGAGVSRDAAIALACRRRHQRGLAPRRRTLRGAGRRSVRAASRGLTSRGRCRLYVRLAPSVPPPAAGHGLHTRAGPGSAGLARSLVWGLGRQAAGVVWRPGRLRCMTAVAPASVKAISWPGRKRTRSISSMGTDRSRARRPANEGQIQTHLRQPEAVAVTSREIPRGAQFLERAGSPS